MTQDEAFDILAMGHNVFLTWAAGSGKTFLVNRFIRHAREHNITLAITASTGIAATHIGGMTIHSWSGMGIRESLNSEDLEYILAREYLMQRFLKTSILIIDEISMLSWEFLASLDFLLQRARVSPLPFGGIQVVLVWDFFQLPPVTKGSNYVEFAFEHPVWREFKLVSAVLTTQFRQNDWENTEKEDPLLTILNDIRSGFVSENSKKLLASRNLAIETEDHTELFTRNVSVDAYNTERLRAIDEDIIEYKMSDQGNEKLVESLKKGCLAPESLTLKKGARVMFVKNNFEAGYANGSIGHVTWKYEWLPVVELLDGTRIIADYADWSVEENGKIKASIIQIPLRLAWAITVHKSQWMTLDSAVMDLSDAFVPGQWYVALSRVRSLSGLILRGLNSMALEIDSRVIAYDKILRESSERASDRLSNMKKEDITQKQNDTIVRLWGTLEKQWILSSLHPISHKSSKKIPTHEETYILLNEWHSLEDIANIRNIKTSTVVSHIEKLIEDGREIDIERFRMDDTVRLEKILDAFDVLMTENLSPVREYLIEQHGWDFDYDEIRLARFFRG